MASVCTVSFLSSLGAVAALFRYGQIIRYFWGRGPKNTRHLSQTVGGEGILFTKGYIFSTDE